MDQIGHAVNPRFKTCATSLDEAIRLGAVAFGRFADQDAGVRWTEPAADAGVPDAMFMVGFMLDPRDGEGDLAEAHEWYRRAADAGNTNAMNGLGGLFWERYTLAAHVDNVDALNLLGLRWAPGDDGDLAEAENWHRRAADAGHTGVLISLGELLEERGE